MRRSSIRAAALAVLLSLTAVFPARARAADSKTVPVERLLPKDVYVFVDAPDFTELKSRFKQSGFGRLWDDKSFAEFRNDLELSLKEISGHIETTTGFKLDDFLSLPSGELCFAVAKGETGVPAVVAFIDFGKNDALLDKMLQKVTRELAKRGAKRSEVKHKGTPITVYTPTGEAAKFVELAYFIKDTRLVVGSAAGALKGVIDRWDGKQEETFATNEVYSYIKKRTQRNSRTPAISWYVDPLGLANAAASQQGVPVQVRQGLTALAFLGVTRFKGFGGSMDWNAGDYDSHSRTVLYVQLPTTGVLDLFHFPPMNQSPPRWVRDNATSYQSFNWDVKKAFGAAAALYGLASFAGPDALEKQLDQWAKDENGPKVHLKKDVLDQLTGRVQVVSDYADPKDPQTARTYAAAGVKDEAKIKTVLEKIAKLPKFPGKSSQYKKHTIYEIDLGGAGAGIGIGAGPVVVSIAVIQGNLMLSSSAEVLKDVIDGKFQGKPLADDPGYKRLVARFPAKTSMLSFERGNAIYEAMRSGALRALISVDFTKLPEYSKVKQYLLPSASYTVPDEHGAYMESISLKPKK